MLEPVPGEEPEGPEVADAELEMLVEADAEVVAGRHPVEEAFAAQRAARRLLVVPHRRAALEALVLHATTLRIPVVEVEGGTLTALAGFDGHQGVALVVEERHAATLDEVLARAVERGERPFVLILDSLEDPQNVGTLLRSAEASGVHGVVAPTRRAAPITPAAVKASAGAVEHLLLVPADDLPALLVDLHARGVRLIGADQEAALSYRDADLRGPIGIVIGSEGKGLSPAIRRRLDLVVRIPMSGRVASLNAAVAGSVLLFEAAAQRAAEPARSGQEAPSGEPVETPARPKRSPRKPPATRARKKSAAPAEPDPEARTETQAEPASAADPGTLAEPETQTEPASPAEPAEAELLPGKAKPPRRRSSAPPDAEAS